MRAAMLSNTAGLALAAVMVAYVARGALRGDRRALSPGAASPGHHLIGSACDQCHARAGGDVQQRCVDCHGAALTAAEDTHAVGQFDDPARAGDLARLDARRCATCHREHRPQLTDAASVTVPRDFCNVCHADELRAVPSHAGLPADGCAAVGCHHYHDNRSLTREVFRRRRDEPPQLARPRVPPRRWRRMPYANDAELAALVSAQPVPLAPPAVALAAVEWSASAHARGGVGCAACHAPPGAAAFSASPAADGCGRCHRAEQASLRAGKHEMRPAVGLPALTPADARLPMHPVARALGCTSCHGAHELDLRRAALESCEGCHDDAHTRAFRRSPHFTLWMREQRGQAPPGSGVSCATCHLPRTADAAAPGGVRAEHDQNGNLRPRDKMATSVCTACHGLPFALAALADDGQVSRNFDGPPAAARTGFDLLAGKEPRR